MKTLAPHGQQIIMETSLPKLKVCPKDILEQNLNQSTKQKIEKVETEQDDTDEEIGLNKKQNKNKTQ
jgi:hypothetical protein